MSLSTVENIFRNFISYLLWSFWIHYFANSLRNFFGNSSGNLCDRFVSQFLTVILAVISSTISLCNSFETANVVCLKITTAFFGFQFGFGFSFSFLVICLEIFLANLFRYSLFVRHFNKSFRNSFGDFRWDIFRYSVGNSIGFFSNKCLCEFPRQYLSMFLDIFFYFL